MASFRPLKFLKAAGTLGITSVALAVVLFAVSIVEHVRDKNVPAYVFIYLAAICFAVGAYMAWSAEADKLDEERAKNQKPLLKVELIAAFFDVSKVPGTQDAQVHVYAYLRVANLNDAPTLIKSGVLRMVVGGVEHTGRGDDSGVAGNWLEHNSGFRLGAKRRAAFSLRPTRPCEGLSPTSVGSIPW